MIERLENRKAYNPIRDHIKLGFERIENISDEKDVDKLKFIANDLSKSNFKSKISRALIFINSKKRTEQSTIFLSEELELLNLPYSDKVDFYHAGLSGIEREEKYNKFQKGEIVILITTKAFGMGMDIKNIHKIYHLEPSSSFEDFLQEVGRAGRNKEALSEAGFSTKNPIISKCLLHQDDFKRLKDRMHKEHLTVGQIEIVLDVLTNYLSKYETNIDKNVLTIPFDLLSQMGADDENINFPVALYWLERFNRITQGMYSVAKLPIRLIKKNINSYSFNGKEDHKIKQMISGAIDYQENKFPDTEHILVNPGQLITWGKLKRDELTICLVSSQKKGLIEVERNMSLVPTFTRKNELEESESSNLLTLEAVFSLAKQIMTLTVIGDQVIIDSDILDKKAKKIADKLFIPENITWKKIKKNKEQVSSKEIADILKDDFLEKRSKFALFIVKCIPNIRTKTNLMLNDDQRDYINYLIYNGSNHNNEWKDYVKVLKDQTSSLIKHVSNSFFGEGNKVYNIIDYLNASGIDDEKELQKIISISSFLAYLKGGGSISSMGIECAIKDSKELNIKDRSSNDFKIYEEFQESNSMKELRLLSLEALTELDNDSQDQFIKSYFSCGKQSELVMLLEQTFGEDHPNLQAFRAIALENEEKKLNNEQRAVYEESIKSNLQVIAGPGSGKTHTLTLRVARLIQKEKISPDKILVLAYNRAVVVELKERLGKLFKSLGYGKLIKRLKIFTFHSFIKATLKDKIDNLDFDKWGPKFIEISKNKPGVIAQELGDIKYVFIDEFQDITNERMELLSFIADPKKVKVCVIGDPNQSIYGYQRGEVGDPIDPKPYYEKFNKIYKPKTYNLKNNYRSYPDILLKAEELINLNDSKYDMPKLLPQRIPKDGGNYCEIINYFETKTKWVNYAEDILKIKLNDGSFQNRQIAIMFRSNEEIFRAYSNLQSAGLDKKYRIRVQGSNTSPVRSREFFHFIEIFRRKGNKKVSIEFIQNFKSYALKVKNDFPNWDKYLIDLLQSIVFEFLEEHEEGDTFNTLVEFIEEIANKEDGHLNKIYENRFKEFSDTDITQEIILTTIHKVKGVEYDAVIIPASFAELPLRNAERIEESELKDIIEEERRLYYVAYTRAKNYLKVIEWEREKALRNSVKYVLADNIKKILGISLKGGIDKLNISSNADTYSSNIFEIIKYKVKIGDDIEILKKVRGKYYFNEIYCNGYKVGNLRSKSDKGVPMINWENNSKLKGFMVSSVEIYTYAESLEYDIKHNSSYSDKWSEESITRGYIYLVDFSGYGKFV